MNLTTKLKANAKFLRNKHLIKARIITDENIIVCRKKHNHTNFSFPDKIVWGKNLLNQ